MLLAKGESSISGRSVQAALTLLFQLSLEGSGRNDHDFGPCHFVHLLMIPVCGRTGGEYSSELESAAFTI